MPPHQIFTFLDRPASRCGPHPSTPPTARSGSTPAPTLLRRRRMSSAGRPAASPATPAARRAAGIPARCGPGPAGAAPRRWRRPGCARDCQQFVEAVLGQPQRVEDRPREQPVQQHEFDDPAGVQHAAVGAQVGVVRARRAQHRHPRRRRRAVADPGQQQPHRHVDAFDRAAQHHEAVAVVAGQRRVGQPGEHRGAALDERQELVRPKAFGGAFAFGQRVVGGVEALPDLGGRDFACAAGIFARRRDRVDDRAAALRCRG